jgi:hypothetical protein
MTIDYERGPVAGNVRAFRTMESVYRRRGEAGLERILRICNQAWPEHKDSASHSMVLGLEIFIDKYGDIVADKRLIEVLSKYDPSYIINSGRILNQNLSSTIYPSIATVIRSLWNKGRRVNKLPESI